jgi:hypothetical protein
LKGCEHEAVQVVKKILSLYQLSRQNSSVDVRGSPLTVIMVLAMAE